jgi:hypothetical protein
MEAGAEVEAVAVAVAAAVTVAVAMGRGRGAVGGEAFGRAKVGEEGSIVKSSSILTHTHL